MLYLSFSSFIVVVFLLFRDYISASRFKMDFYSVIVAALDPSALLLSNVSSIFKVILYANRV